MEMRFCVQLTTWNPTPKGAKQVPDGPIDYASKHWSGLILDYYLERSVRVLRLARRDAAAGRALDRVAYAQLQADLAYSWTHATTPYPLVPQGDAVALSQAMYDKYVAAPGAVFGSCAHVRAKP